MKHNQNNTNNLYKYDHAHQFNSPQDKSYSRDRVQQEIYDEDGGTPPPMVDNDQDKNLSMTVYES